MVNFSVDLKPVGISYLGAFLITNGSCVMVPIMSVVQWGGCNLSCRLMLKQRRICWTWSYMWGFASSHATYLCLFAGFCSSSALKWAFLTPSAIFVSFLSFLLLPSCQSSQIFRWKKHTIKVGKKSPSTLARHAKYPSFRIPHYLLLFLPHATTATPWSLRAGSVCC